MDTSTELVTAGQKVFSETGGWLSDKVGARWLGADRGLALVALAPIFRGEPLLRSSASEQAVLSSEFPFPGEEPAFSQFLLRSVQQSPDEEDTGGSARLAVRLTHLILSLERHGADLGSLGRYVAALPSTDNLPMCWSEAKQSALLGSTIEPRIKGAAARMKAEAADLFAMWPFAELSSGSAAPSLAEFGAAFVRAQAVVASRALQAEAGSAWEQFLFPCWTWRIMQARNRPTLGCCGSLEPRR
ncbi:unnamed protein product [Polarella glacialis]|uniref:Uncharacterized protein n=1 Tax=Polarella glacialis TaxID=89957 RepID=A0A813LUU6_POLGL|nr:unnamed protein product [Polarella glacialis]